MSQKRPIVHVTKEQMEAIERGDPFVARMPADMWLRLKGDGPKDEFGITFPVGWVAPA